MRAQTTSCEPKCPASFAAPVTTHGQLDSTGERTLFVVPNQELGYTIVTPFDPGVSVITAPGSEINSIDVEGEGIAYSTPNGTVEAVSCLDSVWDINFAIRREGMTEGDTVTLFFLAEDGVTRTNMVVFTVTATGLKVTELYKDTDNTVPQNDKARLYLNDRRIVNPSTSRLRQNVDNMTPFVDDQVALLTLVPPDRTENCVFLGIEITRGASTGTTSVIIGDVQVKRMGDEMAGESAFGEGPGTFPTGLICAVNCPSCECGGRIGDFVWHDLDGDGIQDAGEPGIPNVKLTLKKGDGTPITTTTTNASGFYEFFGLCAGDYIVEVDGSTLPAGLSPSPSNQGGNTALDSNGSPAAVSLPTNNSCDDTIDFGYACSGMIGDFVWHDVDMDGIQDAGEPGIPGVKVNLKVGANVVATTTTNASGLYMFSGLCAGNYTVEVDATTLPAGFTSSPSNQGSNTAIDSNGSPATVTLAANNSKDLTIDFGYFLSCTGMIGDFVWHDVDKDGIQDAGEPGIPGVTIKLKKGTTVIATATTDDNGLYMFSGLCAGSYTVVVDTTTLAPIFSPSPSLKGTNRAIDSNGSPATVTLAANNSKDLTIDFGYFAKKVTCTRTQGYWKNHPEQWPVLSLKLGSVTYTRAQLIAIMQAPTATNGILSLAQQLIAAKLNKAAGVSVPSTIATAISKADTLIGSKIIPPIGTGYIDPAKASPLIETLTKYNEGRAGVTACS